MNVQDAQMYNAVMLQERRDFGRESARLNEYGPDGLKKQSVPAGKFRAPKWKDDAGRTLPNDEQGLEKPRSKYEPGDHRERREFIIQLRQLSLLPQETFTGDDLRLAIASFKAQGKAA